MKKMIFMENLKYSTTKGKIDWALEKIFPKTQAS
jgi:hypothetical protein